VTARLAPGRGSHPHSIVQGIAYGLTVLVFALTWIHPLWPVEQAMHGSLAVVGLVLLAWLALRQPLGDGAFVAICVFIAIHCIAARWLYSNVPYDAWLRSATGWSPDQAFGWRRNHADRFIHLLYGLCFMPAIRTLVRRRWTLTPRAAIGLAILLVMASSLVYEWIEWGVALAMSPEQAEAYNGQQGDPWDAHMDMLLATLGALASGLAMLARPAGPAEARA
jgi:putative membrane protein